MGTPRTHILLWLVALGGAVLYFFNRPTSPAASVPGGHLAAEAASAAQATLPGAVSLLLFGGALVFVIFLGTMLWRYHMRRRRIESVRVEEIVLGPDDTATPYEVMSALDAIHGVLLTRYAGTAVGQNSFTFEIVRDGEGGVHFLLAAPFRWLQAIEDIWRSKYTNIRFQPWSEAPRSWPFAQHIVLQKHWRHSTETVKDYQNSVVETIVNALDRAQGEMHLQYLLTPIAAGPMHEQLRQHIRGMEYSAKSAQVVDPAAPGVGFADSQVVKDSLQLMGKGVFRTEIRLAADNWDLVQRVFGALGEANGENSFRANTVVAGKWLWTRWVYARIPSVFLFRSSVMFSFPLATIIHLPTARLRVNTLQRTLVRRGPAPRAIPRDDATAIMRDELGPVGIPEGDRKYSALLIGSQGSGKSTDLLNLIRVDSRYRSGTGAGKAIVLIDIGKDTAKRALGVVPEDREVVWFDPGDPACPWTMNPMLASVNDAVLADNILEGLTQVFGDDAIRYRSREFLGNAVTAIRDVMKDKATLTDVYRLLTEDAFRDRIIQHVQDSHQRQYWQITFQNTVANNPRFVEEGLAAPRNKLDEVLRNPLIRAALESTETRRQIDMRDIVQGRKIFIANLDKSKLGKSGARLIGILLITMLWHALQAQTDIEESQRVPVSLVLDEAQNFISEGFLDILAEGRAYGAQVTVAVRFLGEIVSDKVIKGLQALAQNLVVHQFELLEEAEIFMKRFMRVFANMITVADESQDAINFGADDFMRLPKFYAVCRWMVSGSPQQAFLAQTIPWEQSYSEEVRLSHLARQPAPVNPSAASATGPQDSNGPAPEDVASAASVVPETAPGSVVATRPGQASRNGTDVLQLLLGPDAAKQLLAVAKDGLTGLLTRAVWNRAVEQGTPDDKCTVVFFDLDGLKALNDRDGHAAGDAMLRKAAEALKGVVREGDLAARYGGDELVALFRGFDETTFPPFGKRLRAAFESAGIGVSIGAAIQKPGEPLAEVVHRADQAMYRDKQRRKVGRGVRPAEDASMGGPEAVRSAREARRPGPTDEIAGEDATAWAQNDPRKVFCERYKVQPEHLLAMAQGIGVSDHDLREAANWILRNRIARDAARIRLQRILELKAEDRLLRPVADRLNVDLKTLREALIAADAAPEDAARVTSADAGIRTVEDLQAALRGIGSGVAR